MWMAALQDRPTLPSAVHALPVPTQMQQVEHTITTQYSSYLTNWVFIPLASNVLLVWKARAQHCSKRIKRFRSALGKPTSNSADGIATQYCDKPDALPVLARQAPLSAYCVAPDPTPTHQVRVLQRKINVVHELGKIRKSLSKLEEKIERKTCFHHRTLEYHGFWLSPFRIAPLA